jgi:RNase P subunit RPR2
MNREKILQIVKKWKISKEPEYRSFRCAKCQKNIRKAWHVWLEDKGFKLEVHFCKKCFKEMS